MKTKRFVFTLLALLLICSLPVSAFAHNYIPETEYIPSIDGDWQYNKGTVGTNEGVLLNNGTVDTNNGTVKTNFSGTVQINNSTVNNNGGTVETNNGTVNDNKGTVETNEITGTVTNYGGKVPANYGTVNEADGTIWYGLHAENEGSLPEFAVYTALPHCESLFRLFAFRFTENSSVAGNVMGFHARKFAATSELLP